MSPYRDGFSIVAAEKSRVRARQPPTLVVRLDFGLETNVLERRKHAPVPQLLMRYLRGWPCCGRFRDFNLVRNRTVTVNEAVFVQRRRTDRVSLV